MSKEKGNTIQTSEFSTLKMSAGTYICIYNLVGLINRPILNPTYFFTPSLLFRSNILNEETSDKTKNESRKTNLMNYVWLIAFVNCSCKLKNAPHVFFSVIKTRPGRVPIFMSPKDDYGFVLFKVKTDGEARILFTSEAVIPFYRKEFHYEVRSLIYGNSTFENRAVCMKR